MDRISDYDTVTGVYEDELTLKGSRFIGIIMPCPDESCIQANIAKVMERYRDATHYCYAAIYNGSEKRERSSDNGEPSGTAGKPILFTLKGAGLSDVMSVVVRYFGGTLLGTGGLVHAYTETSKLALQKVQRTSRRACAVYRFTLDYGYYSQFVDPHGQGRGVRAQDHRPDREARQAVEDGRRVHLIHTSSILISIEFLFNLNLN